MVRVVSSALLAMIVSALGSLSGASECTLDGAKFYGDPCVQIESGLESLSDESASAFVTLRAVESAPFTCSMAERVDVQRVSLSARQDRWSLATSQQLGLAYKFYFSRRSNVTIGFAIVDITPGSSCSGEEKFMYYVWSGDSMITTVIHTCQSTRLIMSLRLSSICSGGLSVLRLPVGSDKDGAAVKYTKFDLDELGERFFSQHQLFRDRASDIANAR